MNPRLRSAFNNPLDRRVPAGLLASLVLLAAGGAQAELFAGGLPAFVPPPPPSRMEALAIEIDRHQKLEAGIAVHAKTRTDRGELFKR